MTGARGKCHALACIRLGHMDDLALRYLEQEGLVKIDKAGFVTRSPGPIDALLMEMKL